MLPEIKPVGDKWLMHVHGKPMLLLSGHVMNSSSFDPEYMDSVWPRMKAFHLNTLIAPVSWQSIETVEGVFDFTLVDSLVRQARDHGMHLVLAWFGTWKNGRSFYAPPWVKCDLERFPRMETGEGRRLEVLSNLSENNLSADTRAFTAFLKHLKETDGEQNTVVMVQIQNEVGLLGDSRDRSTGANAAFAAPVPAELMDYLLQNKERLKPHLRELWSAQGCPATGTWSEVFGTGMEADEIFMAWHYARFIDRMAEAGGAVYNLPMYANGWLGQERETYPGKIPSGGPVARMMDIWKAGAPRLDLLAPDIYAFFTERAADFSRADNPLFVPEATALWLGDEWSAPAKAFYTFAEAQGLGFAPFAIDHVIYTPEHPIGAAYGALESLTPLILARFGTGRIRGFFKEEADTTGAQCAIGDYQLHVSYQAHLDLCYGLIIEVEENEFIVAGNGFGLRFTPRNLETHSGLSVLLVEEGRFDAGAGFVRKRIIGGDEVIGTVGVKLPVQGYNLTQHRNNMTILRVRLFLHPPRTDGASQETDETPEF